MSWWAKSYEALPALRVRGRHSGNRARLGLIFQTAAVITVGAVLDAVSGPALPDEPAAPPVGRAARMTRPGQPPEQGIGPRVPRWLGFAGGDGAKPVAGSKRTRRMERSPLRAVRRSEKLLSDDKRVICRYLDFRSPGRIRDIVRRVLKVPEGRVRGLLRETIRGFSQRHRDVEEAFAASYEQAARQVRLPGGLSEPRKLLIGAYLTMEYSIEAVALFNPSIVPHPDQADLPPGAVRFLMSLRATGEGHLSSIVFRRGVIDARGRVGFDPPPRYAYSAGPVPEPVEKEWLVRKLRDAGAEAMRPVLDPLGDRFAVRDLEAAVRAASRRPGRAHGFRRLAGLMLWLARANYRLEFPPDCRPSEIVVFPATEYERRGTEDLRLVRFCDGDEPSRYYGTYTAYDGARVHPMLLETEDFRRFRIHTLSGRYARNKGMALFPRRIEEHYVMLARHDGQNLYLLRSRDLHVWNVSEKLLSPREEWELVHVGNCGSPLETEAGWLVLTHGVGPVRRYCIGAVLLHRHRPQRVIGRLRRPLLVPTREEREGYVPNVVYSCGSMIHRGRLIIPYAMSDSRTAFATVSLRSLIGRLLQSRP